MSIFVSQSTVFQAILLSFVSQLTVFQARNFHGPGGGSYEALFIKTKKKYGSLAFFDFWLWLVEFNFSVICGYNHDWYDPQLIEKLKTGNKGLPAKAGRLEDLMELDRGAKWLASFIRPIRRHPCSFSFVIQTIYQTKLCSVLIVCLSCCHRASQSKFRQPKGLGRSSV